MYEAVPAGGLTSRSRLRSRRPAIPVAVDSSLWAIYRWMKDREAAFSGYWSLSDLPLRPGSRSTRSPLLPAGLSVSVHIRRRPVGASASVKTSSPRPHAGGGALLAGWLKQCAPFPITLVICASRRGASALVVF
jgi:hypothetical protein